MPAAGSAGQTCLWLGSSMKLPAAAQLGSACRADARATVHALAPGWPSLHPAWHYLPRQRCRWQPSLRLGAETLTAVVCHSYQAAWQCLSGGLIAASATALLLLNHACHQLQQCCTRSKHESSSVRLGHAVLPGTVCSQLVSFTSEPADLPAAMACQSAQCNLPAAPDTQICGRVGSRTCLVHATLRAPGMCAVPACLQPFARSPLRPAFIPA